MIIAAFIYTTIIHYLGKQSHQNPQNYLSRPAGHYHYHYSPPHSDDEVANGDGRKLIGKGNAPAGTCGIHRAWYAGFLAVDSVVSAAVDRGGKK